ncbi:hypothetical protein [Spiroplasma taiwanense]|uniref:Uncharacterized protein n=1 Tax=Spiroplasma taiwanense CT-1 TaxID=1276220 RepID=S5MIA7_9MOLU|nr:hypothetical protein [Spiroplasma taiwanense]AGR41635.1 hypothetical protein STAIW_v1c10520 [Spiroplasma taiwanense CT-1]
MKEIKPINYENLIITKVNNVYQNFKMNVNKDFEIPELIKDFFVKNPQLQKKEDIENLGISLDKTFNDWQQNEKSIIITHLLSILQNSLIVLFSIQRNLETEKIDSKIITSTAGVDVIIGTSVQALGMKSNELLKKFDELQLLNDPQKIFNSTNNFLIKISQMSAELAFTKLMENLIEFNQSYQQSYQKFATSIEDEFTPKRMKLLMEYINAYYLFNFLLELILIYPLQEEMMTKEAFDNILPNIIMY